MFDQMQIRAAAGYILRTGTRYSERDIYFLNTHLEAEL